MEGGPSTRRAPVAGPRDGAARAALAELLARAAQLPAGARRARVRAAAADPRFVDAVAEALVRGGAWLHEDPDARRVRLDALAGPLPAAAQLEDALDRQRARRLGPVERLRLARLYALVGQVEKAAAAYRELVAAEAGPPLAYALEVAEAAARAGDAAVALAGVDRVAELLLTRDASGEGPEDGPDPVRDDPLGAGALLERARDVALAAGHAPRAVALARAATALYERIGRRLEARESLAGQARAFRAAGRGKRARQVAERWRDLAREDGAALSEVAALEWLAAARADGGDPGGAAALLEEAGDAAAAADEPALTVALARRRLALLRQGATPRERRDAAARAWALATAPPREPEPGEAEDAAAPGAPDEPAGAGRTPAAPAPAGTPAADGSAAAGAGSTAAGGGAGAEPPTTRLADGAIRVFAVERAPAPEGADEEVAGPTGDDDDGREALRLDLARAELALGELGAALAHAEAVAAAHARAGRAGARAGALLVVAEARLLAGDLAGARAELLAASAAVDGWQDVGRALRLRAELDALAGRPVEAELLWRDATRAFAAAEDEVERARCHACVAELLALAGDGSGARAALREALGAAGLLTPSLELRLELARARLLLAARAAAEGAGDAGGDGAVDLAGGAGAAGADEVDRALGVGADEADLLLEELWDRAPREGDARTLAGTAAARVALRGGADAPAARAALEAGRAALEPVRASLPPELRAGFDASPLLRGL